MLTHIGATAEPVQFFYEFFLILFLLYFYGVWQAAVFSPMPARPALHPAF
jgi:hypothetical protein